MSSRSVARAMSAALVFDALRASIGTPIGSLLFFGSLVASCCIGVLATSDTARAIYHCVCVLLAIPLLMVFFVVASAENAPASAPVPDLMTTLFVIFAFIPFAVGWLLGWPLGLFTRMANSTR